MESALAICAIAAGNDRDQRPARSNRRLKEALARARRHASPLTRKGLPVGFAAGAVTTVVNPDKIFGAAFPPLVSLAVAIILFDAGCTSPGLAFRVTAAPSSTACAASASR